LILDSTNTLNEAPLSRHYL